jgi:hypothetical protein
MSSHKGTPIKRSIEEELRQRFDNNDYTNCNSSFGKRMYEDFVRSGGNVMYRRKRAHTTLLEFACQNLHKSIAEIFVRAPTADLNVRPHQIKVSPLYSLLDRSGHDDGDYDELLLYIAERMTITHDAHNPDESLIRLAIRKNKYQVASRLLAVGKHNNTPGLFHQCATRINAAPMWFVTQLIEAGYSNTKFCNLFGYYAIDWALREGSHEIVDAIFPFAIKSMSTPSFAIIAGRADILLSLCETSPFKAITEFLGSRYYLEARLIHISCRRIVAALRTFFLGNTPFNAVEIALSFAPANDANAEPQRRYRQQHESLDDDERFKSRSIAIRTMKLLLRHGAYPIPEMRSVFPEPLLEWSRIRHRKFYSDEFDARVHAFLLLMNYLQRTHNSAWVPLELQFAIIDRFARHRVLTA